VDYSAQLLAKPQYVKLADALGVSALISGDEPTAKEADQLGRAVGRRLARGRDAATMRRLVFSRLSGNIQRVRLIAFARQVPNSEEDADKTAAEKADAVVFDGFERGVVAGLTQQADRVVGVETTGTEPSNIKWYNSLGLSTVDNVEQYPGYYSLVQLFAGAKGDFGTKKSADALIPQVNP
jgi:hypothetical protein